MKNIGLVLEASRPSKATFDFAAYLCRLTGASLRAFFLCRDRTSPDILEPDDQQMHEEMKLIERSRLFFIEGCRERSVQPVLSETLDSMETIFHNSHYADLIVIDPGNLWETSDPSNTGPGIHLMLTRSHCPVIISPKEIVPIEEIVFAYNNSEDAMYALKQFTYLLPELAQVKITLLTVNSSDGYVAEERRKLLGWLGMHYSNIHFELHDGPAGPRLLDQMVGRHNCFLVMGAYSRSSISYILWPSSAEPLIKQHAHPIFIAHA